MKYKIIDILRTFSDKEPRQFESFLMSPYHNDSKKIIRLYKALMKFYPEFEAIKMNEEKISHEVNPDLPYNKSTFKTMMFELANCADEFLKISIYKTKKATSEDYLREEYFKRKLFKLENQNALKMLSELDSDETWTSDNFYYKFRILTDLLNHHLTSAPRTNVDYGKILIKYLSNRTECVTNFFILETLASYNNLLTHKKTYKIDEANNYTFKLLQIVDLEKLIEFAVSESGNEADVLQFKLQLANYRAFSDFENEDNYMEYKILLKENLNSICHDDLYSHFICLIKYCMMKPPESSTGFDFKKELFSIYKFILHRKYYIVRNYNNISIELYKSVLYLGLELKKYRWTLNFIKNYHPKLNKSIRENMYNYSLAMLYFHKKRFDDALRLFHKVELNQYKLRIDLKNLMLMTYYELHLYENALSLIDSYKHFLKNTEMLSNTEISKCRNFISIIQKMIKYRTSVKPVSKFEITNSMSLDMNNKTWLKDKIAEIDSKFVETA